MKKNEPTVMTKLGIALLLIAALAIVASISAGVIMLFGGAPSNGNVAIIPLEGVIVASTGFPSPDVVTSDQVIDDLEDAASDDAIKAVVLLINSPGGSAVASDEVAQRVQSIEKPVVAVIREVGASGAYWIASSADEVFANRMSITGSIGVIGSYLSFGRFLDNWNVTYNRLVAGDLKDLGTPFRELTPREKQFLQAKLDLIHEDFIRAVAENRNLSVENVTAVADGRFLLGREARDVGLVDELGTLEDALDWINMTYQVEPEPVWYTHEPSIAELLSTLQSGKHGLPSLTEETSVPMAR